MADLDPMASPVADLPAITASLSPEPESKQYDEAEICEEARERFKTIDEDDRDNRERIRNNFKFVYTPGEQWDSGVKQRRANWKEPCLEFNQLPQFVNQIIGDALQNRPAILVDPANGQGSKEVAEIQQGMIRNMEYQSVAEKVYDKGLKCSVVGGRGWWRVCTEWVKSTDPMRMFNQNIFIRPIPDPLAVYADLDYQQPDGSDRNFAFVIEKVQKKDYERRWPDKSPTSWHALDELWKDGKEIIVVADYYRRIPSIRTLVAMSDGAVGWLDEMPAKAAWPAGVREVRRREVETFKVEWHKIAGGEQLLESHELPGEIIPVISTCGDDVIIDGKRTYKGLIDNAKDSQTMFNFGMTAQAIHLALTPRAPWVAPQAAIDDYKDIWKNANVENYSVLPYRHQDDQGNPIPAPTRTAPSTPDAGWDRWCSTMQGVMRSTIGMYQNSLGQQGTETSGKAILAREKQGDTGTFHFIDNLHGAIALTGRVIQSWIPTYYDTEQIVQIIGPDDTRKMVTINQRTADPTDPLKAIKANDVTVGEYAVVVEAGPGYATKRQETSERLMQLVQSFPPIAQVAGDLVVKSLDVADADQIADRLKMMLPPPIQQAMAQQEGGGKPPDQQTMMKMRQMGEKMQGMEQALGELQQRNQELESGAATEQAKLQVKARGEAEDRAIRARNDQEQLALDEHKAQAEISLKRKIADDEREFQIYKAKLDNDTKLEIAAMNKSTDLRIAQMTPAPEPASAKPQ